MRVTDLLALVVALACAACRQDMHDQPRVEPFERSAFFPDGWGYRPQVAGTVARGELAADAHLETGWVGGALAETFPFPVTREVLLRGRERFDIFCSPCHDRLGSGRGMIVRRGMKQPESLHSERLRAAPPGHFVDVMTNGFGVMFDYADRVPPADRWAIAAWIQTLQLSQNAPLAAVPAAERTRLEALPEGTQ